jgi:oxygen-independent coproporphyrinogen-3 oxidase
MGYTTRRSALLLGLGVSSISDTGKAFAQNAKTLHDYYESVNNGRLAIRKGYVLSEEDKACRRYILDIACKGETEFRDEDRDILEEFSFPKLRVLQQDGLVVLTRKGVYLTQQGRYFIRNICSAFDLYLAKVDLEKNLFSKAV